MPGFVNPRADDRSPARHPQFRQSSPSTSARPFGLTKRELDSVSGAYGVTVDASPDPPSYPPSR
jgi:hypothetical protein